MRARPSPLEENDSETAAAAEDADDDVIDSEVERSIDVIPEDTPGSQSTGSSVTGSTGTRSVRPLLKDTVPHHASTSV